MPTSAHNYAIQFRKNVSDKYIIYNSLFAALPYSGVANVGALLPILLQTCEEGFSKDKSPIEIVDYFFKQHTYVASEKEKLDHLFKYVQYMERQVVLFDAIEDAAFSSVNEVDGIGSLKALIRDAEFLDHTDALKKKLEKFKVRLVLTAHPTQFYPANVLGIIHDMGEAIGKNDFNTINQYIQQLGLTPFFNKKQPSPTDEALTLMWYLENIFYHSVGNIYSSIVRDVFDNQYEGENPFIELGFWPGGDRDGNPFVNGETTLNVAKALRSSIIVCYYRDVRKLKRKLTFSGVAILVNELEAKLYENVFRPDEAKPITTNEIIDCLNKIKNIIIEGNYSLYLSRLESLLHKVKLFGTHFASLDIRQDSRIHHAVLLDVHQTLLHQDGKGILPSDYNTLDSEAQMSVLAKIVGHLNPADFKETITKDTLGSIYAITAVQKMNGIAGCHRYIISNCQSAINVMELYALCRLCGMDPHLSNLDIVPLFETIEDLTNAEEIMSILYNNPLYKIHLQNRQAQQPIMLGFSDGTKDGGYLQANWSIYKAKETLTKISRANNIVVKFFDGRGGPPSRGGGKTHQFYASMGDQIENEEIQLTLQGQTITSNFGTIQSAQFNIEQLLSAGISNEIFTNAKLQLSEKNRELLEELGHISYVSYQQLKENPLFLPYLQKFSPLNYYGKSNIASRPTKRGLKNELSFSDLRAIPFVGSWSQLKQNVPGYYGVGTALQVLKEKGLWNEVASLFNNSAFFRTLVDNSMMSMVKSNFAVTKYVENDEKFTAFRQIIKDEFILTTQLYLELNKCNSLMEKDTLAKHSILLRDRIVLPLLTIQQFALCKVQESNIDPNLKEAYEKLVTRTMFGVINAARNSA
ncbi:MAG: phosphoenolpyruvate carboxylase [Sediminibacterium sp.]|jgi:phosphoenolpyruvate carboxylase|nr:phosphoenolpyruvate carboxylase [Sediminibacterium sp.]